MLFLQSCFGSLVLTVLSWSSCPDRAVLAVLFCCMFCLSRSAHLVLAWLAVLSRLSCSGCPVLLSYFGSPVLFILFQFCQLSYACLLLTIPFYLVRSVCPVLLVSFSLRCPFLAVLLLASCLGFSVFAPTIVTWQSCPGCLAVAFLICLSCSACPSLPFPFILSFPAVPFFLFCSAFLFWLYHHERNGDCKSKSANMKELGSANFTVKKTAGGSAQASGTQTRREKSARPAIVRVSLRIFCLLK
jgi:hypothetical protein